MVKDARDTRGVVFRDHSAILLKRVTGADGTAITKATIASASYTIYELEDGFPDNWSVVTGHENVALTPANIIFDTLQTDDLWDADSGSGAGYNFKLVLNASANSPFPTAGKDYLVVCDLVPSDGEQTIPVRFLVECI